MADGAGPSAPPPPEPKVCGPGTFERECLIQYFCILMVAHLMYCAISLLGLTGGTPPMVFDCYCAGKIHAPHIDRCFLLVRGMRVWLNRLPTDLGSVTCLLLVMARSLGWTTACVAVFYITACIAFAFP
jgi:hypothetical protein